MARFTIVTQWRGATYISQGEADDVTGCVLAFADQLETDKDHPAKKKRRKRLAKQLRRDLDAGDAPVALEDMAGVWVTGALIKGGAALLNIIQTTEG
jgi:hypothetical protein